MIPMAREAAKRVVLTLPREDVRTDIVGAPSFEILDDRQPNAAQEPIGITSAEFIALWISSTDAQV